MDNDPHPSQSSIPSPSPSLPIPLPSPPPSSTDSSVISVPPTPPSTPQNFSSTENVGFINVTPRETWSMINLSDQEAIQNHIHANTVQTEAERIRRSRAARASQIRETNYLETFAVTDEEVLAAWDNCCHREEVFLWFCLISAFMGWWFCYF